MIVYHVKRYYSTGNHILTLLMISLARDRGVLTDPPNPRQDPIGNIALEHGAGSVAAQPLAPPEELKTSSPCSMATAGHPIPSFEPATPWPSFTLPALSNEKLRGSGSPTTDPASAFVATSTLRKGRSTVHGPLRAFLPPVAVSVQFRRPSAPCVHAPFFFSPAIASACMTAALLEQDGFSLRASRDVFP